MESSDPIHELPLSVRDKIWSFLNIKDLQQARLVSAFWRRWSIPRFRDKALIRLSPTTPNSSLTNYVAEYGSSYLHQNFLIDTTFLQVQSLDEYINITMSMDSISVLFEEYGQNVKRLIFKHRDCIQQNHNNNDNNTLTKEQVLEFLYTILRNCPLLEELELDVDVLRSSWFPEDIIFCELKSLRLDSLRSNAEENDGQEILALAQRIADTIPNLQTFITRELWSKLQSKLLSNMATNYLENYRFWPNLTGVKILERIRYESRLQFGKKLMEMGVLGLDTGITNRPLTVLHLGRIEAEHHSTAFRIMDTFRLSLIEVQMSVEIKEGLVQHTIHHMPNLKRLYFVDCTIDVSKMRNLSDDDDSNDSDFEIISSTIKKKTNKRRKASPKKEAKKSHSKKIIYKKEMFDFCNLSRIFWINSVLKEVLPELHTLELTFAGGFRRKFYKFFFPGLLDYPRLQIQQSFPQIRNLIINYPCLQFNDQYLGWTQAVAKLFPKVHNKHLNTARSRPEFAVYLEGCYSDSGSES